MKQYKLIIKDNFSENLSGILSNEAKGGWRLNSYESNAGNRNSNAAKNTKNQVVLVFEK